MNKEYISSLSDHIEAFIAEKHSLGYKYNAQEGIMRRFDKYWLDHGYGNVGLTPENLSGWTTQSDSEGAGSLHGRVCTIRQFSLYLNGIGISSYIPYKTPKGGEPLRHIFTLNELEELFDIIDTNHKSIRQRTQSRIADEYPVLFRLIFHTGMRVGEALSLSLDHIDLQNGKIIIMDGKGNKDRIVWLSDDMKILCSTYVDYLGKKIGDRLLWLFPGLHPSKPLGISAAERCFNKALEASSFSGNCSTKPTVHDLRHTFVVMRINLWNKQGIDFEQMKPYLSKYLGHKSFDETFYYYHYVEETAKNIREKDTVVDKVIPEVLRR